MKSIIAISDGNIAFHREFKDQIIHISLVNSS